MNQTNLKLYLVTDASLPFETLLTKTEEALKGGVTLVQYRSKNPSSKILLEESIFIKKLCDKYQVPLIINDRVDIALAIDAAGVHVGADDLPVSKARKILGKNKIIGATVKTPVDAKLAEKQGADHLGVGAIFPSSTKPEAKAMSLKTLEEIKNSTSLPLVGIGGITYDNLSISFLQYLDGIALVSEIYKSNTIEEKAKELYKKIHTLKEIK